jgi:Endomembrane protein 70
MHAEQVPPQARRSGSAALGRETSHRPIAPGLQVHGDVLRPPQRAGLLSVYVGTGAQLIGMALVTMVFAALGFLSPANRGGLMTAMLLLFVFMGLVGGYASARLYKVSCLHVSITNPVSLVKCADQVRRVAGRELGTAGSVQDGVAACIGARPDPECAAHPRRSRASSGSRRRCRRRCCSPASCSPSSSASTCWCVVSVSASRQLLLLHCEDCELLG